MSMTLDQLFDFAPGCLDPAFQSLPFGAERVEKFGQLDHRNGERDWIARVVTCSSKNYGLGLYEEKRHYTKR